MANSYKRVNYDPVGGSNAAAGITYDDSSTNLGANNLQEAVEALDTLQDATNIDIAALQGDVTSLDSRLDTAELDIDALQVADTALDSRLDVAESEIDILQSTAVSLDTRLDTAEIDIDQLQSDLAAETLARQNADAALDTRVDTLELDVQGLETDLAAEVLARTNADTALDGRVDILEQDVVDLQAEIDAEELRAMNAETALSTSISGVQTNLTNHVNSTTAHAAQNITYSGALVSTNVGAAIDELATRPSGSPGDIVQTSFGMSPSASSAPVVGFLFSPAVVRSFSALVSVSISATVPLFEEFEISGVQRGSDFVISYKTTGDNTLVTFDITPLGQVTYSSGTYAGYTSGVIKFRSIVTGV